jgi:hypothetical protein
MSPEAIAANALRSSNRGGRRTSVSARSLRECFTRGTELQPLCAMAGLPVLASTANNGPQMARSLHTAVRLDAEQNPQIFTAERVQRDILRDGGECPPITEEVRTATARAIQQGAGRTDMHIGSGDMHIGSAAVAKEVHSLMRKQTKAALVAQLGFPPRRVLQDPTGASVRFGSGFDNRALKATAQRLGLTPPASMDHHIRLNAAYRRILAQLWLGGWQHSQAVRAWTGRAVVAESRGVFGDCGSTRAAPVFVQW